MQKFEGRGALPRRSVRWRTNARTSRGAYYRNIGQRSCRARQSCQILTFKEEIMSDHHQPLPTVPSYPFRLDVPLHKLLQETPEKHTPESSKEKKTLPTPVFPSQPELFHDLDAEDVAAHDQVLQTGKRHWPASRIFKNMRGWMVPYF